MHFFLDNEQTETVLANGKQDPSRLSRSADELDKGELSNLEVSSHSFPFSVLLERRDKKASI